jgi:hypothetical protein
MADPCQPLPNDTFGRFSVEVTIQTPIPAGQKTPAHSTKKKLVADTGGSTLIPYKNIKDWNLKFGPLGNSSFGPVAALIGAEMVVEVEDYGRGNKTMRTCGKIEVHFAKEPEKTFGGCEGLLGMNQFNVLNADPAKLTDGTPYMCIRAAPKPADAPAPKAPDAPAPKAPDAPAPKDK